MNDSQIKFFDLIHEFMSIKGWEDPLQHDEESGTVFLKTSVDISGQNGTLVIEASDVNHCLDVFFYYPVKCKESKFGEMCILLNELHQRWALGRFELDTDDGLIRWRNRADFSGAIPSGVTVDRVVQAGWSVVAAFFDTIAAVALTKKTATDALVDYDSEEGDK
jgi:hypothetical protein